MLNHQGTGTSPITHQRLPAPPVNPSVTAIAHTIPHKVVEAHTLSLEIINMMEVFLDQEKHQDSQVRGTTYPPQPGETTLSWKQEATSSVHATHPPPSVHAPGNLDIDIHRSNLYDILSINAIKEISRSNQSTIFTLK